MTPSLCSALLPVLSLLTAAAPSADGATYLPLSYSIPPGVPECLYERIAKPGEHLTASVFVLSGEELRSAVVLEGPVAPVDLDLNDKKGKKNGGGQLQTYLTRYGKEGVNMFVKGKFGDSMMNVKPVRIAEWIDFEEEEEDYYDDYELSDADREEFNRHHDAEHRRPPRPDRPPPPERDERGRRRREKEEEEEERFDDDFVRMKEQARREQLEREAMLDDDFVKLQLADKRKRATAKGDAPPKPEDLKKMKEVAGDAPKRRQIVDDKGKGPPEDEHGDATHRRLREENVKLMAGEPYEKTIKVVSPGWYRFCVHPTSYPIEAELELRKSSLYGEVDPHTGHVPTFEDVEVHSEIHHLFEEENDEGVLAEEGAIKDEDLRTTKEQLRILEKVYADITAKQLEERRVWNWRTIKNQHLYSHLVLGNLVETVVYMAITGWQVYTIRKWFGGGPALGR